MNSGGPLGGVRVLEVAGNMAGPFAGAMLRDFGAEVVKIEQPGLGDPAREWPPMKGSHSLPFIRLNVNKKSVAADLRHESGRALVRRLVVEADVVITAFRLSTLDRWGLRYSSLAAVNPRIVVANVTGFGLTGPNKDRLGFGSTADAVSGLAYISGWPESPPTLAHFGLSDLTAGLATALGIMTALYRRQISGKGDEVDVALYEPMMVLVGDIVLNYTALGRVKERSGNTQRTTSPAGIYRARDGKWLTISGSGQRVVERLFRLIGREAELKDLRYATNEARVAHDADIQPWVVDWVQQHDRDAAVEILTANEIVAGPVNSAADVVADPHFRERTLRRLKSQAIGEALLPGPIGHLGSYPGIEYHDAPEIGEHTGSILREWLGASDSEIEQLTHESVTVDDSIR